MARGLDACQAYLSELRHLFLPNMFVGWVPWAFVVVVCALAGIITQGVLRSTDPDFKALAISIGSTLAGTIVLGLIMRILAHRQVRVAYEPIRQSIAFARGAADDYAEVSEKQQEAMYAAALRKRDREVARSEGKSLPGDRLGSAKRNEDIAAADAAYKSLQADDRRPARSEPSQGG